MLQKPVTVSLKKKNIAKKSLFNITSEKLPDLKE